MIIALSLICSPLSASELTQAQKEKNIWIAQQLVARQVWDRGSIHITRSDPAVFTSQEVRTEKKYKHVVHVRRYTVKVMDPNAFMSHDERVSVYTYDDGSVRMLRVDSR